MSRCAICGEYIARWPFYRAEKHPHYKTVHADYVLWHSRYRKNLFIVGLLFVIAVLYLDIYSLVKYDAITVYPLILVLVFYVGYRIDFNRHLRQFRHDWNRDHSSLSGQP